MVHPPFLCKILVLAQVVVSNQVDIKNSSEQTISYGGSAKMFGGKQLLILKKLERTNNRRNSKYYG